MFAKTNKLWAEIAYFVKRGWKYNAKMRVLRKRDAEVNNATKPPQWKQMHSHIMFHGFLSRRNPKKAMELYTYTFDIVIFIENS